MKRSASIEHALLWHLRPRGPRPKYVLPPRSVLRLTHIKADWEPGYKVGDTFTVNYYSRQDGLHCVWLINPRGEDETWDQHDIVQTFEVISLSDETDFYGLRKPELPRP